MPRFVWLFLLASLAFCEEHRLTLRQAVELAAKQNPDVALARIDEEKARAGIRVARDPFLPRLVVGSGLAYSSGFPLSVEGSAPTIFQANARQYIFNRPQSFQIAQAKEDARGAGYAVASKRDEVVYRAAALYLDAERASRVGELARKSITDQQQVLESVQAQVREGRALPLAEKQAALAVARSRQLAENLTEDAAAAQSQLAILLGFAAEDRVLTVEEERAAPALPESEEQAVQAALRSNAELRQIQSQMASKQLEIRGERAQRLPRIDLVAQYGMLAKFNNYAEFFQKYQRNNGEIGMSFQVPLFSPAVKAMTAQSDAELARLKLELTNARNRIAADLQQAYRDERKSASAAEVARLDLDVARAQIDVDLALMQEGRLTMREMEQARLAESDKWIAFYDAQYTLEKARWNVLRMTGGLEAAIAGAP
ncbi:MAG TPA: TolC family protein [Candidatus Limnocylindrales bacterium]|nr:TolC family protein [Candidatus Limnocylindrales bacterium]